MARTPIETRIANLLEEEGITFREQTGIGRRTVDFLILRDDGRPAFILECDGANYHEAARDRERDAEIEDASGLKTLRFSGKQINFSPEECVEAIKAKLASENLLGDDAFDFSPAQREVVNASLGPLLVYAPAGSGKTRILIGRIAHLIQEKRLAPERICALTFTHDAAAEIKMRVAQHVSEVAAAKITVCTFHALAGKVKISGRRTVIDEDRRLAILIAAAKRSQLVMPPAELGNLITRYKANLVDLSAYSENLGVRENNFDPGAASNKAFLAAWTFYEGQLSSKRECDYDDLLLWFAQKGRSEQDWSENLSSMFDYVLVDEAQDNNRAQDEIVNVLTKRHTNCLIVGDDDQSIYGFRGAQPSLFREKENTYNSRPYFLDANYRSHPSIVLAALGFVTGGQDRRLKPMAPKRIQGGEAIKLYECNGVIEEARTLATRAHELRAEGCDWGDIAILVRSNYQSQLIAHELANAGIPSINYSDDSILKKRAARVLIAYARVTSGVGQWSDWKLVLSYPNQYLPSELRKKLEEATNIIETWEDHARSLTGTKEEWKAEQWLIDIEKLRDFSATQRNAPNVLLSAIRSHFKLDDLFDQVIDGKVVFSGVSHLQYVQSIARACGTMESFFHYLTELENVHRSSGETYVKIMTIHKAKGLEFPCVFLTGLAKDQFPHPQGDYEEERRLCYVAMTRAKDNLLMIADSGASSSFVPEIKRCIETPIVLETKQGMALPNSHLCVGDTIFDEKLGAVRIVGHSNLHGIAVEDGETQHRWIRIRPDEAKLYIETAVPGTKIGHMRFSVAQRVRHKTLGEGKILEYRTGKGYLVDFFVQRVWLSDELAAHYLKLA